MCAWKWAFPKRKVVLQPSISRFYVSFREGIYNMYIYIYISFRERKGMTSQLFPPLLVSSKKWRWNPKRVFRKDIYLQGGVEGDGALKEKPKNSWDNKGIRTGSFGYWTNSKVDTPSKTNMEPKKIPSWQRTSTNHQFLASMSVFGLLTIDSLMLVSWFLGGNPRESKAWWWIDFHQGLWLGSDFYT